MVHSQSPKGKFEAESETIKFYTHIYYDSFGGNHLI